MSENLMAFALPSNLSLGRPGLMQVSNNPRPLDNFKPDWPSSRRLAPKSLLFNPPINVQKRDESGHHLKIEKPICLSVALVLNVLNAWPLAAVNYAGYIRIARL
jgi:hypothetical protein